MNKNIFITNLKKSSAIFIAALVVNGFFTADFTLAAPKELTVSGLSAADKIYDGATTADVSGTPVLVGVEEGNDVSLTGAAKGEFNNKNAGDNTVAISGLSLTGADAGKYILTQPVLNAKITPRPITVATVASSKTYNGNGRSTTTPSITSSFSPAIAKGDLAYLTQRYEDKNVGTGIALTLDGNPIFTNGNYSVTMVELETGIITQKAINVTAQQDTKTYDGTINSSKIPVIGDLAIGDSVFTPPIQEYKTKDVGANKILKASGLEVNDRNGGLNYSPNYIDNTAGIIKAKELTVTGATTNSKTYDGNATAIIDFASAGLSGILPGEEALVSLNSANYSAIFNNKNVGTGKTVIVSGLTLNGAGAGNYSVIQPILNDGVITARILVVTASGATKPYDDTVDATGIVTLSDNRVPGDALMFGYTAVFTDKKIGKDIAVNVTGISIGGLDAGNYSLGNTTAETTGNITPASLTATITASDKVYDGNTSAAITSRALVGIIKGDNVFANEDGAATFSDKNVGAGKTVSAIGITIGGADIGNYIYDGTAKGTADIFSKPITVTADSMTKTYGDPDPEFTYQITAGSLVGGDKLAGSLARGIGENVNNYGITQGNLNNSNYNITFVSARLTINKRPITVTAVTDIKVYDGATSSTATSAITHGLLAFGDTAGFTQSYDNRNAGENKILTPNGAVNDGNNGDNYDVTFKTNATGVITKKALIVTAENKTKEYGASDPDSTYTYSGLVHPDTNAVFSGKLERDSGEAPGNYNINQGTVSAGSNYKITYNSGILTIAEAIPLAGGGGGGGGTTRSNTPSAKMTGDMNNDAKVNKYDFALMMSDWGKTGLNILSDLNNDKKVDKYDFSLLMVNWSA